MKKEKIMTAQQIEYLKRLECLKNQIASEYDKRVFDIILFMYRRFLEGKRPGKYVTKEVVLKNLCKYGLEKERDDGSLPDDRKVRDACRRLLKLGYPIMTSCSTKGYYIAETIEEIQKPMNENHKRALETLAVEKGYKRSIQFLLGQGEIGGEV